MKHWRTNSRNALFKFFFNYKSKDTQWQMLESTRILDYMHRTSLDSRKSSKWVSCSINWAWLETIWIKNLEEIFQSRQREWLFVSFSIIWTSKREYDTRWLVSELTIASSISITIVKIVKSINRFFQDKTIDKTTIFIRLTIVSLLSNFNIVKTIHRILFTRINFINLVSSSKTSINVSNLSRLLYKMRNNRCF